MFVWCLGCQVGGCQSATTLDETPTGYSGGQHELAVAPVLASQRLQSMIVVQHPPKQQVCRSLMQVPTTVMSQVDSSVGGKTGVNHPLGKNMIGAFYQPRCVLIDTTTLDTLPPRELASGVSEIVKYGLIRDAEFFEWLEANMEKLLARDPETVAVAVERSCINKVRFVIVNINIL